MIVFAERGGMALGPEHTLKAIERSIALGAEAFALNVQPCLTGEPILMHDATVERTTRQSGEVAKMTIEFLTLIDCGEGQPIMPLAQLLDHLAGTNALFLIEMMHPKVADKTIEIVQHYIKKRGYVPQQIILASAYHQLLAKVHELAPKLTTAARLRQVSDSLAAPAVYTHSRYLIAPISDITPALLSDAKAQAVQVIAEGCTHPEAAQQAMALPLYGIIAPDPTILTTKK